jgi:hypothetical protein
LEIISNHAADALLAEEEQEERRLHWRDYVALFIAAVEAYSLPFVVIICVILAITVLARLR